MKNNYEINASTLAIIPNSLFTSKIIEINKELIINKTPYEIIDDSCRYFGSSYQGRYEGTKSMLGMNYKLPIVIEETRNIIFFPTTSPKYDKCAWISLNNIEQYTEENLKSVVKFKNGVNLELDISFFVLENQILRASRLENVLRKRHELKK